MNLSSNKEPSQRQIQVALQILNIAQDFFQRESNGASLITVTRAEVSPDMRHGDIFITVLPENKEDAAINFAKRMRSELRHFVMKRLPIKVIPFFEVSIDYGEKNRQHIDALLRKEKTEQAKYEEKLKDMQVKPKDKKTNKIKKVTVKTITKKKTTVKKSVKVSKNKTVKKP